MNEIDDLKSQIKELERRRDDAAISRNILRATIESLKHRLKNVERAGNALHRNLETWYNIAGSCGKVDGASAEALVDWEILTKKNDG